MILTLEPGADVAAVARALVACGQWAKKLEGGGAVHFMIEAHSRAISDDELARIPGVAAVAKAASPHPRLDAQARTLEVAGVPFGHGEFPVLLAGPCSVESEERIREIAEQVAEQGATFLRGGAMKPRTSPYSFTGHGDRALRWLRDAADAHGLRVVTEALGQDDLDAVAEHADLIQIGSRNMQNFALLRAAGRKARPVLLKRGLSATIEEWLLAAEHLLVHGAAGVILCERGIRSFDPQTRNLLDLGAVSLLAHVHGLPVIV
ncbi:MAG: 3-deoxy-7-phosphoheptulonate synthase, partial [Deltaproteobacteria bacterium]|nr:3-deoxy-7-phosphoheptulonate synthase [Deltaproteobacteria bacterium]